MAGAAGPEPAPGGGGIAASVAVARARRHHFYASLRMFRYFWQLAGGGQPCAGCQAAAADSVAHGCGQRAAHTPSGSNQITLKGLP